MVGLHLQDDGERLGVATTCHRVEAGGVWSAGLLPAGEYYLANERYPSGHWNKPRRRTPVELDVPVRTPAVPSPVVASTQGSVNQAAKKPKMPEELTPTRKLVKAIVDAGGMLEMDIKDDNTSYKSFYWNYQSARVGARWSRSHHSAG